MDEWSTEMPLPRSPLEEFVRDYVEVAGGVWDEIEPEVYDVLLPSEGKEVALRLAFDPEALPEHPGAQLASYGTPLVDSLLADAIARGRFARLHLVGLNLNPHDLAGRVRRALTLPEDSRLTLERVRLLDFVQVVFWFQATFVSDQKEQEVLPVALDLHYGRQVRHLERLLDRAHLSETPAAHRPEARRLSLAAAYPLARAAVVPTVAALANTRAREAAEQAERQVARMVRYYADLRAELEELVERARGRGDSLDRFAGRREALEREERVRVAELRQKATLRIELRLLQLLVVRQPKFLLRTAVVMDGRPPAELELVWDPLMEVQEAAPCPQCGRPTLAWEWDRLRRLVCPACAAAPPATRLPRR
jgi:hypothetical protein